MIVVDAKTFGEMIRKRRKSLHYTQKFLAAFSGFSASFISDLENGKASIELGRAICLAQLLGLDCELKVRGESE